MLNAVDSDAPVSNRHLLIEIPASQVYPLSPELLCYTEHIDLPSTGERDEEGQEIEEGKFSCLQ